MIWYRIMEQFKFNRELYSKTALIKAAYNFTDIAYIHLDADDTYYYVMLEPKNSDVVIEENAFVNEMLAQSVRHEIYKQTRNIRELLLARAMATSVILDDGEEWVEVDSDKTDFSEDKILADWFEKND